MNLMAISQLTLVFTCILSVTIFTRQHQLHTVSEIHTVTCATHF